MVFYDNEIQIECDISDTKFSFIKTEKIESRRIGAHLYLSCDNTDLIRKLEELFPGKEYRFSVSILKNKPSTINLTIEILGSEYCSLETDVFSIEEFNNLRNQLVEMCPDVPWYTIQGQRECFIKAYFEEGDSFDKLSPENKILLTKLLLSEEHYHGRAAIIDYREYNEIVNQYIHTALKQMVDNNPAK